MAGKTVAEKLLLRPGGWAWVSDGARVDLLGPLPKGGDGRLRGCREEAFGQATVTTWTGGGVIDAATP